MAQNEMKALRGLLLSRRWREGVFMDREEGKAYSEMPNVRGQRREKRREKRDRWTDPLDFSPCRVCEQA